ncbi:MAG TPA: glycosyltransferase family 4 protein [Spirochaetota bacterium]|nr:glycosyltransferase family 4 protein [Spirochaetota bacterium]
MKILHIIDSMGLGGAQTVLKGIFESQKTNSEIFLFSLRNREINIEIDHSNVVINKFSKKYSIAPIKQLKTLIRKENIEIIHCHLFKSQIFGYFLKLFYFPNIKLIFHEHGEIFQNHIIYNAFMKISRNRVDLYLAVSKATKKHLIDKIKIHENKIHILYNFVDLNKFNSKNVSGNILNIRDKLRIEENEFVVGFVGRLSKIKGCKYLINSLPYLKFNYKCLIAGTGKELNKLKTLSKKLKVENKIIFLGYKDNIYEYYPLMNVLIIPSSSEASPMAFYEAQSLGIPVIGSDVTALNEFIIDGKNGFLFKYGDFKKIAEILNYLYDKKDIKFDIGQFSKENIQKYSLENYIKNLYQIYDNIQTVSGNNY